MTGVRESIERAIEAALAETPPGSQVPRPVRVTFRVPVLLIHASLWLTGRVNRDPIGGAAAGTVLIARMPADLEEPAEPGGPSPGFRVQLELAVLRIPWNAAPRTLALQGDGPPVYLEADFEELIAILDPGLPPDAGPKIRFREFL